MQSNRGVIKQLYSSYHVKNVIGNLSHSMRNWLYKNHIK